jgi:hypothetical protein
MVTNKTSIHGLHDNLLDVRSLESRQTSVRHFQGDKKLGNNVANIARKVMKEGSRKITEEDEEGNGYTCMYYWMAQ